jgi:hypothetical protein
VRRRTGNVTAGRPGSNYVRERDYRVHIPSSAPASLPKRPRRRQRPAGASLLLIGVVAFIFGVALHVYVVKSVLDSGSSSNDNAPTPVTQQQVAEATATQGPAAAEATVTTTALPDRTSCEEIRGTSYRSTAEREFFLTHCLTQTPPTTVPTATPVIANGATPVATPRP